MIHVGQIGESTYMFLMPARPVICNIQESVFKTEEVLTKKKG